jgi:hypothetical protein
VGRVLVIETASAVIVFLGVPVKARPALRPHLRYEPINQQLTRAERTRGGIDKQILEVACSGERRSILVNDVIRNADDILRITIASDGSLS